MTNIGSALDSFHSRTHKLGLDLNRIKTQAIVIGHQRLLNTIDLSKIHHIKMYNITIPFADSVRNLGIVLLLL